MDNEYLQAMTDDTALTVSLKSDWLFGNVSDLDGASCSISATLISDYQPRGGVLD